MTKIKRTDFSSMRVMLAGVKLEWTQIAYSDLPLRLGPRPLAHVPARHAMSEAALFDLDRGPLIAKHMASDPFMFRPTDKILLATSHKPQARTDDRGIWRRGCLLPMLPPPVPYVLNWDGIVALRLAIYLMEKWTL